MTAPNAQAPVDVLSRAIPVTESGCYLWEGARSESGYGRVYDGSRMWQAHRLVWTQVKGPIPHGLFVCHKCDTPPCVNPDHLFLGTAKDNNRDMAKKGRHHCSKAKTCVVGHSLSGENLLINNRGDRVCLECKRKVGREWKRAAKAKRVGIGQ